MFSIGRNLVINEVLSVIDSGAAYLGEWRRYDGDIVDSSMVAVKIVAKTTHWTASMRDWSSIACKARPRYYIFCKVKINSLSIVIHLSTIRVFWTW